MNLITINSSLFYLTLSLIILFNCVIAEKFNKRVFVIFNVFILTFIAGFRAYSVGRDTSTYVTMFNNFYSGSTFNKDPLFAIICRILMTIIPNPTFVFLILALIIYSLISYRLWELKDDISYSYAFMTFYSFYFFESMNVVRQFTAVAIIFFATRYLQKQKYLKFVIFVIIASIFHFSALLGLLCLVIELFLWKSLSKKQKKILIIMYISGILLSPYAIFYLSQKTKPYWHYFNNMVVNIGMRLIALIIIFILSLLLFNYKSINKIKVKRRFDYILKTTRIYFILACLLGAIGYFYQFMERLGLYFALFEGIYFGIIVKEKKQINRYLMKWSILFILCYVLINYIFFKNGARHHPYYFIWS